MSVSALSYPSFFEGIRDNAARRWDQLEADPELAAPWEQLFKQVQSPQHVISELLQNADDANAMNVSIRIDGDVFVFEHDGEDFREEHLASLCRFGFSNKRHLHTIGFRGIGFKSTFSLGDEVRVVTPSLNLAFKRRRFTEPVWVDGVTTSAGRTQIRIRITKPGRIEWLKENMQHWGGSPASILFFRNIRKLQIDDLKISVENLGVGPTSSSQWVELRARKKWKLLLLRSEESEFPEDAIEEVRAERGDESFQLPPCTVEVVLGLPGKQRLFTVLPTGAEIGCSVSCNGPFIQDPGRLSVKHPVQSPINNWLLERAGKLIAETLIEWVQNRSLSVSDRADSYALVPPLLDDDESLPGQAAQNVITRAFRDRVAGEEIVLCSGGKTVEGGSVRSVPKELFKVWGEDEVARIFCGEDAQLLSQEVGVGVTRRLAAWGWTSTFDTQEVCDRLTGTPRPSKPDGYERFVNYWAFLDQQFESWDDDAKQVASLPAIGEDTLRPESEVVILFDEHPKLTEQEWQVIRSKVNLLDPAHLLLLKKTWKDGKTRMKGLPTKAAYSFLEKIDGWDADNWGLVISSAVQGVDFEAEPKDGICLAHIASRFDVSVNTYFPFVCTDGAVRKAGEGLLGSRSAAAERLLGNEMLEKKLIDSRYFSLVPEEYRQAWEQWVRRPEKSRLRELPLPTRFKDRISGLYKFRELCATRGGSEPSYEYQTYRFEISDCDFDDSMWNHWESLAKADEGVWQSLAKGLLEMWPDLREVSEIAAVQISQQSTRAKLYWGWNCQGPKAAWIHRLSTKRCLTDDGGRAAIPGELMLSTPQNAYLQGIERFIHPEWQTEASEDFLTALGVRSNPDSSEGLVYRIRALSQAERPPIADLHALYSALDRVFARLPEEERSAATNAFQEEELIYADEKWWFATDVFQSNDNALPEISIIPESLSTLRLWDELGVPSAPSPEHAIEWLSDLPQDEKLPNERRQRVKSLLKQYPERVWEECGCWLALGGQWRSIEDLLWKIDGQPAYRLFPQVQEKIADLSFIQSGPLAICSVDLPPFETQVTEEITELEQAGSMRDESWLSTLGTCILRIKDQSFKNAPKESSEKPREEDTKAVNDQKQALRLAQTKSVAFSTLHVTPKLRGEAVGEGYTPRVLWRDSHLYTDANLRVVHRELERELASKFQQELVRTAVKSCIERSSEWIEDYFEQYFDLRVSVPELAPNGELLPDEISSTPLELEDTPQDDSEIKEPPKTNVGCEEQEEDEEILPEQRIRQPRRGITAQEAAEPFFLTLGFEWRPETKIFTAKGGVSIRPIDKSLFPWGFHDHDGALRKLYWISGRPLEEGISIAASVWEFFKDSSRETLMVFPKFEGGYLVYNYAQLSRCIQQDEIEVMPERYRLVTLNQ